MATSQIVSDRLIAGVEEPVYTWRRGSNQPDDTNYYLTIGDADSETTYEGFLKHVVWFADRDKNITFKGNANIENFQLLPNSLDGSVIKTGTIDGSKIKRGTTIDANISGNAYSATRYMLSTGAVSGKTIEDKFKEVDTLLGSATDDINKALADGLKTIDNKVDTLVTEKRLREVIIDMVYPVGSIYMSYDPTSPKTKFGGNWTAIGEGRCIMAAGEGTPVGNGGSNSVVIAAENLPAHSHGVTVSVADTSHGHDGAATAWSGAHTHGRGTMNITGAFIGGGQGYTWGEGAFYNTGTSSPYTNADDGNKRNNRTVFSAEKTWVGETSEAGGHSHAIALNPTQMSHGHTATCDNGPGKGKAISINPTHFAVYMWRRTA